MIGRKYSFTFYFQNFNQNNCLRKSALISNITSSNDLEKILKSFDSLPTNNGKKIFFCCFFQMLYSIFKYIIDEPQTMAGRLFRLAFSTSAEASLNEDVMNDHSPDVLIAAMMKYMSSLGVDLLSCDPGSSFVLFCICECFNSFFFYRKRCVVVTCAIVS